MTILEYQVPIAGTWRAAEHGETFGSENPFSGDIWAKIPRCTAEDVNQAVDAAYKMFKSPAWRGMTASDRGRMMAKVSAAVIENAEHLAQIEARDNGKLITEMRAQITDSARWWTGWWNGLAMHGLVTRPWTPLLNTKVNPEPASSALTWSLSIKISGQAQRSAGVWCNSEEICTKRQGPHRFSKAIIWQAPQAFSGHCRW